MVVFSGGMGSDVQCFSLGFVVVFCLFRRLFFLIQFLFVDRFG